MQVKIFTIPILDGEKILSEMNAFLRSHRVLQMESELVNNDSGAFWCFCVRYLDEVNAKPSPRGKKKVDYREILDEAGFRRFTQMRLIRKNLAKEEGIPAFAIFTDEEMAGLAKIEDLTLPNMKSVKGVGEKKAEKYGRHFISKREDEKGE